MRYIGNKARAGVLQRIINLIPPHDVFIEPFAGSAGVAREKRPAAETILIDKSARFGPAAAGAIPGAVFIQGDGIKFLKERRYTGREMVYCDPPYLAGTRQFRKYYEHEMSEADHRRLLLTVRELPCRVMVSGYASALYDELLSEWPGRDSFEVGTRGGTRTECLWFNYDRPVVLHDFSHVGENKRERLYIRRMQARWVARFMAQPPQERAWLLAALVAALGIDVARVVVEQCDAGRTIAGGVKPGAEVLGARAGAAISATPQRPAQKIINAEP